MFKKVASILLAAFFCHGIAARADEPTRQVQEELRKRHLFYGDVDGRPSASLGLALKQYQARKGFAQTGVADADTLRSMGITTAGVPEMLPDVPVLRSDRGLPEGARNTDGFAYVSVPQAVKGPPPTRAELLDFIRRYLEAAQTPSVNDELAFYGDRVRYFDHGTVNRAYIRNELVVYQQHWPLQQYSLGNIVLSKEGNNTRARVRIAFDLANPLLGRKAEGKTDSTFLLARQPDLSWEIIGLKEARVREVSRRRAKARPNPVATTMRKVQRSVRKLFR